jgi:hypothetical protein
MGLFVALRALYPVQNFVALVDSWSSLLFASKADRVVEVADDAPIPEMQLRREIKLNRHAAETLGWGQRFRRKIYGVAFTGNFAFLYQRSLIIGAALIGSKPNASGSVFASSRLTRNRKDDALRTENAPEEWSFRLQHRVAPRRDA